MRKEKRKLAKKAVSFLLSTAMLASTMGTTDLYAANANAAKVVRLDPTKASVFNDTNGDGLGEFEGFGTSLCWWANRIGYNSELTSKAGELFFNPEKGLGMSIGRYNLGGGDLVGEVVIPEAHANEKAMMYDLESDGRTPSFQGSNMDIGTVNFGESQFKFTEPDFGFKKGNAVGSFKVVGWINRLEDEVGSGDKLRYTVNVPEAGKYTVKFLLTLTGTNQRDVALRVMDNESEDGYKDYVVGASDINSKVLADNGNNKLYLAVMQEVYFAEGENDVLVAGKDDWTLDFIKMAVIKAGDEASEEDMFKDENGEVVETPEFLHAEHIIRSDSAVPGYCTDVTRMDLSKKSLSEYKDEFDRVDETSGFAWNYDWNADRNQINVLKAAISNAGSDFIPEIFSNSPPYFMTESGCSSGNFDANKDNLRADCYEAFAKYMADVIKHWEDNGITFQSATPMNEPYTNYWAARSNKQEGCHFEAGESQSKIYVALDKELKAAGVNDIILSASDETSIDTAITAYNKLSDDAKNVVSRIDTHSYGGSKRTELKNLALSENKNLWMSEVDGSFTAGDDAGQMSAALGLGQQMITDVNGLRASAWILWNAIDMHVDSSEYGKSFVDKGSSNDFLSAEKLYSRWIPNDNSGYWGFAAANHDTNEIYLTKKYYGFGQFSRYIRPGYTIIGSSNEGSVMAAYDSENEKVVAVVLNTSKNDETWKFDLSLFNDIDKNAKVTAIRTSGSMESGENWADVSNSDDIVINTNEKYMSATLKGNSITTYIIEGVKYDASNPVTDNMVEIKIPRSAISGSTPWSGGTGCDVDKLIDNDFGTFFDGVTDGYVIIDLGAETKLSAIAFAPRSGYTDRAVGAMIAGSNDGENWTKLYTITERPSAGSLTYIYSSQFAGNKNTFRYIKYYVEGSGSNCNVAEIKLFTNEPTVSSVENIKVVAAPGKAPVLPARVEGKTTSGEKHSFMVEWNVNKDDFVNTKLLDTKTVTGNLVGNSLEVEATVLVLPDSLEYFVDCNNSESENFKIAKENISGLLNTTPDQKKTSSNDWGALAEYGAYNGSTSADAGWYAKSKQDIEYSFTLPAGQHELTACASGKWWNSSRAMDITYIVDGVEKDICKLTTLKGKEIVESGVINLDKASVITVRVKKSAGESQDPVLSWITIEGPITFEKGIVTKNGTINISDKVDWDIDELKVTGDLFTYMNIDGKVNENAARGSLLIIPEDLEYFISCNQSESDEWKLIKEYVTLKNASASDQKKSASNTWGRLGDYGSYNGETPASSGWYAYNNQNIEYSVKLAAGVHEVNICASGKWWDTSRRMAITYEVNGQEKELCSLTTLKGKEIIETGKIILKDDADVIIRVKKANGENQDPVLSWISISDKSTLSFTGTKGDQMYDVDGNRIQAHGGQIQKLGDTWYWIGEDKTYGYQPCPGIHMYTSKDLYNWEDAGLVLKTMESYDQFETDEYFKNLYGDLSAAEKKLIYTDLAQGDSQNGYKTVIERPKMLYNEKTDKYVIWFHADGKSPYESGDGSNYSKAKAGIAIADSPTGPYTLLGSYLLASGTNSHGFDNEVGGHVRDMNLFKDDDGTAYVLYSSEGNAVMYIAKLNDSYTGLVKDADKMELGKDFVIASTDSREAPAMFKYENKYYLITSGCTGWDPNQARYAVADSPLGDWTIKGDPCVGDSSNLTFRTQSTCVIPVDAQNGKFIYMGDRWFSNQLDDSRYVWLPIEFGADNTIMMCDYQDWTLADLENKASIKVQDELITKAKSVTEALESMPEKLSLLTGGKTVESKVSWSVSDAAKTLGKNFIGELVINGTLTDMNRSIQHKVIIAPENLVYLSDCFTNTEENTSEMFKKIAAESKYLKNTVSDQAYAKDPKANNSWGYVSSLGAGDAGASQDMGSKGTGDFYETGWWATSKGSIAYAYELEPGKYTVALGFNEWWSATREMKTDVISVDSNGKETVLGNMSFTLKNEKALEKLVTDIVVPENSTKVIVKVGKKSGGDPILSWIGIIAAETPKVQTRPETKPETDNTPANNGAGNTESTNSNNASTSSNTSNASSTSAANTNNNLIAPNVDTNVSPAIQAPVQNSVKTVPTTKPVISNTTSEPEVTEVVGEEETKTEEVKAEETKTEEAKSEETKIEESKSEELTPVENAPFEIKEEAAPTAQAPDKSGLPLVGGIIAALTVLLAGIVTTLVYRKRKVKAE